MAASTRLCFPYLVWLALFLHLSPPSYFTPFQGFASGDDRPFNSTQVPRFNSTASAPLHTSYLVPTEKSSNAVLIAGICIALSGVVIAAAGFGYVFWIKRRRSRSQQTCQRSSDDKLHEINRKFDVEDTDHSVLSLDSSNFGPRSLTYRQLCIATKNFSDTELLGHGGFGSVYKGILPCGDGTPVAVKRISKNSRQGLKEFAAEVTIISRIRHRHLVELQGWCHENGSLLLVYDYMPNGSLDRFLFSEVAEAAPLIWSRRYAIVCGLGAALQYLHEECEKVVIHRDVKSSNVMLDANFTAKLGDFGLARQLEQEMAAHTTIVAGTLGYMAPECYETGRATRETDVFSFGAVLLEVASGRRPWSDGGGRLVEWVWKLFGAERLMEAADPRLCRSFEEAEMQRVLVVGLACSHPEPSSRPSIREALLALQGSSPLPVVPPHKPIASYYAAPRPPLSISQLLSPTSATSSSFPAATVARISSSSDDTNVSSSAVLLPR